MRASATVLVSGDELWSIVAEVWESILGQPAARVDHAFNLDEALTGTVAIHGEWEGLVTLTCPAPAARGVARAMLGVDADVPVSHDDVVDALGEITNVVGGQVKALCPGDNRLGLPEVTRGMVLPQAMPCCRLGVEWAGHVARVGVWRSTATAVGSVDGEAR